MKRCTFVCEQWFGRGPYDAADRQQNTSVQVENDSIQTDDILLDLAAIHLSAIFLFCTSFDRSFNPW